MSKQTIQAISTENSPKAIGPYAQAISVGDLLYLSGQLGVDPATGELKDGVENQTKQALENIRAVLDAAGGSMARVVKTTVFLANMSDFAAVNAIYGAAFQPPYPARSCVQVAALPKGGLVEIEVVCAL